MSYRTRSSVTAGDGANAAAISAFRDRHRLPKHTYIKEWTS